VLLTAATAAGARQDEAHTGLQAPAAVPGSFALRVGELLTYDVKFGPLKVGRGSMEVLGVDSIRGRMAWHTRFRVRGGIPFYHVDDRLESWIDTAGFRSLRFVQDLEEGGRNRERRYEIDPGRRVFREDDKAEEASVADPLDDGAFLYFVRTLPLEVGVTYSFDRYFRPDRNPVVVRVLGRERVSVPAGTFTTLVLQPVIKAKGIFSEKGEARIWLTDDADRIMVQMKSKTKIGSLSLHLLSHRPPTGGTR
jgi:Protein of unknown function (DUF3108)